MFERFHVTYEIVTPESAEQCDAAERGFLHGDGWREMLPDHVCGDAAGTIKQACSMRLRQAIELIGCLESGSDGFSYYEVDGTTNYRTGAETRLAFHLPDTATPSSVARVARLLKERKLI